MPPELLALFQNLVRMPSVLGQEHGAVELVESELETLGLDPIPVPFDPSLLERLPEAQRPICAVPDRRNIVAIVPGQGGGKRLILNCHLDVVPAGDGSDWSRDPYSGDIVDSIIHGRGAFDDKAGAVICFAVLEAVRDLSLRGDLVVHFVLEDETTGNGSLLCLDAGYGGDAAVIVDGTRGDRGINQHAGNIRFGVSVSGKSASVSVSHMGVNAAEMLARLIVEIESRVSGLNAMNSDPWTMYPSPNQISVVGLHCEETTMTVPSKASAICYATFTPPHDIASFRRLMEQTGQRFASRHSLPEPPRFDWTGFAAEPVRSDSAELEATISNAAGRQLPFVPSTGTSDMRHFVARGIPCVLFGPGDGSNPHRANESFDLSSLTPVIETLQKTVINWCS